ncbi:hypothetical protein M1563_03635 [Patescibacteria group bacterium]|nr:hypothetical protein [Patescibacteria group bacterium]
MNIIDNLKNILPLKSPKEASKYYFALNIGLSSLTAAVWKLEDNALEILGQSSTTYTQLDELLEKSGQILDEALDGLPFDPEQILFGIPDSWSNEDELKENYLKVLQEIVKEYDLDPMAYVTTTHALAHLFQKQDGVPPTALMLGIGGFVEVTLLRGGKAVENRAVKRSDHLFDDIEKTLLQFTEIEVLPSRILLYPTANDENLPKIKDELTTYPWMGKLPFLHFPKIELLADDATVKAIVLAGAIEENPDIDLRRSFLAKTTGTLHRFQRKSLQMENLRHLGNLSRTASAAEPKESGFITGDIQDEESLSNIQQASDFDENEQNHLDEEVEDLADDQIISPDIEDDQETHRPHVGFAGRAGRNLPESRTGVEQESFQTKRASARNGNLSSLTVVFQSLIDSLNKMFRHGDNKLIIFGGGLVIVLVAITAAYYFLVKATVTIYVEPKVMENTALVTADPAVTSIDEEKKVIPGTTVTTTVTGSGTGTATGTKQIGDPAKGQIVIYNKTYSPKTFSQGTVLVGPDNLKFTLDDSVNVASQSALDEGIAFGKATAPVTASAIGPDSNLAAGTELAISSESTDNFSAKVDQSLTGGTSKDVTVVTTDDQKKLQAQVVSDLRSQAQEKLQQQVEAGQKVLPESLEVADSKYSYSKQVNDQATDFTLTATLKFKGTAYTEADLQTIISKLVAIDVPDNYQLDIQNTQMQSDVQNVDKNGRLIFQAKYKANLLPKLDTNSIKHQIQGQSVDSASQIIQAMDNVLSADFAFKPAFVSKIGRLPFKPENITILVTPK